VHGLKALSSRYFDQHLRRTYAEPSQSKAWPTIFLLKRNINMSNAQNCVACDTQHWNACVNCHCMDTVCLYAGANCPNCGETEWYTPE